MRRVHLDFETYSSVDITKAGVYKYVESADFEILLGTCGETEYALKSFDMWQRLTFPDWFVDLINDPEVIFVAWNAQFERLVLRALGFDLPVERFECTMGKAAMLGLPLKLEKAGEVLRVQTQKDSKGKSLIRYFSVPCKPTKSNGQRVRNLPYHDKQKWADYKSYNRTDVITEIQIDNLISFFTVPTIEKKIYCLDQRINDRGIQIDVELVENAVILNDENNKKLLERFIYLTGVEKPASPLFKQWISDKTGTVISSLRKDTIDSVKEGIDDPDVLEALHLRGELTKTSIKKYKAILTSICEDGRVRGIHQYYGANRTGRFAGRLLQGQNMVRNDLKEIKYARELVKARDAEMIDLVYGGVSTTLSQLTRTAIIAKPGYKLGPIDFSSIESRVIAWLAQEQWKLDVFNGDGKIYEAIASRMFGIPIEDIAEDSDERQRGKVAELGLGFGGGTGALITMGALKKGIAEEELPGLVTMYRIANPKIVKMWREIEKCAKETISRGTPTHFRKLVFFTLENGVFFIKLPSGRKLSYQQPRIINGSITYWGIHQEKKIWCMLDTYGGKLVENIVQAIARDLLCLAMLRLEFTLGAEIVMHVHDEVVPEISDFADLKDFVRVMTQPVKWAPGLPLAAKSFETYFYKK